MALNNQGQAAGDYYDASGFHGFLRSATGAITTFYPPGSPSSRSRALNNQGNPRRIVSA